MSKAKSTGKSGKGKSEKPEKTAAEKARSNRETVESIIIAVILAFLFRAFEAEAFVIPTGSMAPTLEGRHFDVECDKCHHRYRTGASDEHSLLIGATCPICRYTKPVDPPIFEPHLLPPSLDFHAGVPDECAMSGDRILVNKFAYELAEPQRWDVIVFKYPGNAKQNYIKRLIGLPGERIRIQYGNVYVKKQGEAGFRIARKPPEKVKAMLQLVDDTNHIPDDLIAGGWPSRWQNWPGEKEAAWKPGANEKGFVNNGGSSGESWLRYQHLVPSFDDWEQLKRGIKVASPTDIGGQLITDFYAYNCQQNSILYGVYKHEVAAETPFRVSGPDPRTLGWHWVGDIALEAAATVNGPTGEVLLDLIKGGVHYQCRIDVASGTATLSIDGGFQEFQTEQGPATQHPTAATSVKGPGKYNLRFGNVDDQLFLWVNESPVKFDGPTTYGKPTFTDPLNVKPFFGEQDPGDLAPIGIGSKGAALELTRLRVLRDVYYIADNFQINSNWDYVLNRDDDRMPYRDEEREIRQVLSDPRTWQNTRVFDERRSVEFPEPNNPNSFLGPSQFFPCGDNSPASKDGRLWSTKSGDDPPPYVERNLLIGKALYVYWPHTWNRPIPFITPNIPRMRLIK